MIHIENLVKRYGDLVALNHLSLDIHEGEIFGLLGPNGSGKTTAINCLLSLLKYDKGTIEIFGQPMTPDNYQAKQQIGIVVRRSSSQAEYCLWNCPQTTSYHHGRTNCGRRPAKP